MKIELLTDHYASANGFKLSGAGIHEVPNGRARYLLTNFPDWFRTVDVVEDDADTDVTSVRIGKVQDSDGTQDASGDTSPEGLEAAQNEADEAAPAKPLSRMNKDELQNLAIAQGLGVSSEMTNDELREAIKLHEQGLSESGNGESEGDAV